MPELPEVEAARRAVQEHCAGKRIVRAVVANDDKVVADVAPAEFEASLTGKTVVSALRKGKNLWIQLDSPPFPSFQFGMSGAIHIKGVHVTKYKRSVVSDVDEWPSKYSKVFLQLDDGLELSFTDKRRFARVRLLQNPESMPPISELGPDAFLEPMLLDEFVASLNSKKISIKGLLLDQSYIAGIGNWIADEVLYQARIHPLQVAGTLTRDKCEKLLSCIKEVVHFAVGVDADCDRFPIEWLFHFRWGKKAGNVLEKAVDVGADSNRFPSDWIFHSREKKPGEAFVDGKKIEFIRAGGRTTAFVPALQKLDHSETAGYSSTGSKKSGVSKRAASKRERAALEREEDEDEEEAGTKEMAKKAQRTRKVSKAAEDSSKVSKKSIPPKRVAYKRETAGIEREEDDEEEEEGTMKGKKSGNRPQRTRKVSKVAEDSSKVSKKSSAPKRATGKREKTVIEREEDKVEEEGKKVVKRPQRTRKVSKEAGEDSEGAESDVEEKKIEIRKREGNEEVVKATKVSIKKRKG